MHRCHAADTETLVHEVRTELLLFGRIGAHDYWNSKRRMESTSSAAGKGPEVTGIYLVSSGVLTSSVKAWMGPLSSSAKAAITIRWRSINDLPANPAETTVAFQWSAV